MHVLGQKWHNTDGSWIKQVSLTTSARHVASRRPYSRQYSINSSHTRVHTRVQGMMGYLSA